MTANIELLFQNDEKAKRAAELVIANKEKATRASELVTAKRVAKVPSFRSVATKQLQHSEYVAEEARRRAQGICQLCDVAAPFINKSGHPYLEVHHVVWLARGGDDSLENTVALCPNCHRRIHVLDSDSDKDLLLSKIASHS